MIAIKSWILSVKVKIFALILLFAIAVLLAVVYLVNRIEEKIAVIHDEQSMEEQRSVFRSVVKAQREGLASWMRPYLNDKNIMAPLLLPTPDLKRWEVGLVGTGNQISFKFGVIRIITFNKQAKLVYDYTNDEKISKVDFGSNSGIEAVIQKAISAGAITHGLVTSVKNVSFSAVVLPTFDDDDNINYLHLFICDLSILLRPFHDITHFDSNLRVGDTEYHSEGATNYDSYRKKDDLLYGDGKIIKPLKVRLDEKLFLKEAILTSYVDVSATVNSLNKLHKSFSKMVIAFFILFVLITFLSLLIILRPLNTDVEMGMKQILQAVQGVANGDMKLIKQQTHIREVDSCFQKINQMVEVLSDINRDVLSVVASVNAGNLSNRPNSLRYNGDYKLLADGINMILNVTTKPIFEVIQILRAMSELDLTKNMDGDYRGEYLTIKNSINLTLQHLNATLSETSVIAIKTSEVASFVRNGNRNINDGANLQAVEIEGASAIMNEMHGETEESLSRAQYVQKIIGEAKQKTELGREHTMKMEEAIKAIENSAKNISNMVGDIEVITFKTNLLALNAAVEAAHAGSHGKGFVVVAEEVRDLAKKTAKATKEIAGFIGLSMETVENGKAIAGLTSSSFDIIYKSFFKISDLVDEMVVVSREQFVGIEKARRGLSQVREVARNNLSIATESAQPVELLANNFQMLSNTLKQFKLVYVEDVEDVEEEKVVAYGSSA